MKMAKHPGVVVHSQYTTRMREKDCQEFKVSLPYRARLYLRSLEEVGKKSGEPVSEPRWSGSRCSSVASGRQLQMPVSRVQHSAASV